MAEIKDKPNMIVAWSFVAAQAIILGLLIFLDSSYRSNSIKPFGTIGTVFERLGGIGILLSVITIRSSLTAVPLPKKHGRLGITGLYKYVRHPMYTSVLLVSLGIELRSGSIIMYLLVIGLLVLFSYKARYEEHYLHPKYIGYAEYTNQTPQFIPCTVYKVTEGYT